MFEVSGRVGTMQQPVSNENLYPFRFALVNAKPLVDRLEECERLTRRLFIHLPFSSVFPPLSKQHRTLRHFIKPFNSRAPIVVWDIPRGRKFHFVGYLLPSEPDPVRNRTRRRRAASQVGPRDPKDNVTSVRLLVSIGTSTQKHH